ncbi:MAG: hypothetical protein GX605_03570 [Chloroflexi bacterium]|nr:hypothetical protein [Chloroflexota bacterium]
MKTTDLRKRLAVMVAAILLVVLTTSAGAGDPTTNALEGALPFAPDQNSAPQAEQPLGADLLVEDAEAAKALFTDEATLFINVPAAAFINDGNNDQGDWFTSFGGGYLQGKRASGSACFSAPLYLPPGATVVALEGWLYDNSDGQTYLRLYNRRVTNNVVTTMAEVLTTNSTAVKKYTDTTVVDGVMTNNNAYFLGTCLQKAHSIHGARLTLVK